MRRHLTPLLTAATATLLLAAACSSGDGVQPAERATGIDGDIQLIAAPAGRRLRPAPRRPAGGGPRPGGSLHGSTAAPYPPRRGRPRGAVDRRGDVRAAAGDDAAAGPRRPPRPPPTCPAPTCRSRGRRPDVVKADGERIPPWPAASSTGSTSRATPRRRRLGRAAGRGWPAALLVVGDTALVLVNGCTARPSPWRATWGRRLGLRPEQTTTSLAGRPRRPRPHDRHEHPRGRRHHPRRPPRRRHRRVVSAPSPTSSASSIRARRPRRPSSLAETNRRVIESPTEDWLPGYRHVGRPGRQRRGGGRRRAPSWPATP